MEFDGHVETPKLNLGGLIDKLDIFGEVGMNSDVSVSLLNNKLQAAKLKGDIAFFDFKGTLSHPISRNDDSIMTPRRWWRGVSSCR